jgi:hypothetical protein
MPTGVWAPGNDGGAVDQGRVCHEVRRDHAPTGRHAYPSEGRRDMQVQEVSRDEGGGTCACEVEHPGRLVQVQEVSRRGRWHVRV